MLGERVREEKEYEDDARNAYRIVGWSSRVLRDVDFRVALMSSLRALLNGVYSTE